MKKRHKLVTLEFAKGLERKVPAMQNTANEGFTLIELLVVIVVIGILAAIGLPTLLRQVNRAQATSAQTHIGAINRAQQGYLFEHSAFAGNLDLLGLDIPGRTNYHTYSVQVANTGWTTTNAIPMVGGVRGYTGVAYIYDDAVYTFICEGPLGSTPSVTVTYTGGGVALTGCDSNL